MRALAPEGRGLRVERRLRNHLPKTAQRSADLSHPPDRPLHRYRCCVPRVPHLSAALQLADGPARKNSRTGPPSVPVPASPEFFLALALAGRGSGSDTPPRARPRVRNRLPSTAAARTSSGGIPVKAGRDAIRETHSLRERKRQNKHGRAPRCSSPLLRRRSAAPGSAVRGPFSPCFRRSLPKVLRQRRAASCPSATAGLARSRTPGQKINLRA